MFTAHCGRTKALVVAASGLVVVLGALGVWVQTVGNVQEAPTWAGHPAVRDAAPKAESAESTHDNVLLQQETEDVAAVWEKFLDAIHSKAYDDARQLLPFVKAVPTATKTTILPCFSEALAKTEAQQLASIGLELFNKDELPDAADLHVAILQQVAENWPSATLAGEGRAGRYALCVANMPLSARESDGLIFSDVALATVCVYCGGEAGIQAAVEHAFSVAAKRETDRTPFYEPFLSGLIRVISEHGVRSREILAAVSHRYSDCKQLSERLRFELKVLGARESAIEELLSLLESLNDINEVQAALDQSLSSDQDYRALLDILIPYLESRFGSRIAANLIKSALISGMLRAKQEQRAAFGRQIGKSFLNESPGSGRAVVLLEAFYAVRFANDARSGPRALVQDPPAYTPGQDLIDSATQAEFIAAVVRHWQVVVRELEEDEGATNSIGGLCEAIIEASRSLIEAVRGVEAIEKECKRYRERVWLRRSFHRVLMKCRARYPYQLESEPDTRSRLICMAESLILSTANDPITFGGSQGRSRSVAELQLSDQLLAMCLIEEVDPLPAAVLDELLRYLAEFENRCFENVGERRQLHRSCRQCSASHSRVVERLNDPRLAEK